MASRYSVGVRPQQKTFPGVREQAQPLQKPKSVQHFLRPATLDDWGDIKKIFAVLKASDEDKMVDGSLQTAERYLVSSLGNPQTFGFFLATTDAGVVGFLALQMQRDPDTGVLYGLIRAAYILPAYRATDIAETGMALTEEWVAMRGGKRVFANTQRNDLNVLFGRHGFKWSHSIVYKDIAKETKTDGIV